MSSITRPAALVLALACACIAPAIAACSSEQSTPQQTTGAEGSVVQEHEGGSIEWSIGADGKVAARVADAAGKAVPKDKLSGTLAWKATAVAEAKAIALDYDAKAGALVAAAPKLEADVTEVGYTVTVDGKPWSGTLHLPPGGTAELSAGAKASAEASAGVEGKVGPHGGVVQVVGDDRYEIVSDEASGEVRVYVLGPDLKVVAVGDRTVTLGVIGEASEVVALAASADGKFLVGKWSVKGDPVRITLVVRAGGKVTVAVVGHKPGASVHFAANAKAPKVKVRVKGAFDADADADVDVKGKAKAKVDVPDVDAKAEAKAKVKTPDVKVDVKNKGGKGKASAKASIKIN